MESGPYGSLGTGQRFQSLRISVPRKRGKLNLKFPKLTLLLLIIPLFSSDRNGVELPIGLTEEEKGKMHIIEEMGRETDPPPTPIRNIAEFEPMQGVLIRYPFGISYSIIAEMSEDIMVTTIVSGQSQENTVTNYYSSNGVNLDNCIYSTEVITRYHIYYLDLIWYFIDECFDKR